MLAWKRSRAHVPVIHTKIYLLNIDNWIMNKKQIERSCQEGCEPFVRNKKFENMAERREDSRRKLGEARARFWL